MVSCSLTGTADRLEGSAGFGGRVKFGRASLGGGGTGASMSYAPQFRVERDQYVEVGAGGSNPLWPRER